MKRILSFFLSISFILLIFSGCHTPQKPEDVKVTADGVLVYSLNQEMIDRYYDLLSTSEELAVAAEDFAETERVNAELDDAFMLLYDQYQIAYVLYCLDQSDAKMKQQYVDALGVVTGAESAYNEMCKRVWLSETPFRDQLFAEWSQADIDCMLKYDEEIAALEKRNGELTLEFRDLPGETMEQDMIPLYNELVRNNNRIARIYGYDNYYDYAYEMVYQRDYGMDEIERLREYTAQYLVDVHRESMDAFYTLCEEMDDRDEELIKSVLFDKYDSVAENYVDMYIRQLPQSARENMQSMFTDQRVIFTEYKKAYPGAFTTWIGERPYCYFGPGYAGSETVAHELGHYYATKMAGDWGQPMDLAETQSQGNEWLFIRFLSEQMNSDSYQGISEYKLLNDVGYIICFVMIDQFEQLVYTHENAGNLSEAEYEKIMEDIAAEYGGLAYIDSNILDLQNYWRMVVLESPVYYVSYAVSGIAAIDLFAIGEEDMVQAYECYVRLVEETADDMGFSEAIRLAGLNGPFEETAYKKILKRYEK